MIIVGKKDMKNRAALLSRKEYLQTLLGEGRPNASPSSQEWVSYERYQHTRQMLLDEVAEIDAVVKRLK